MKPILEHLRDLSDKHRERVKRAEETAERIRKTAEAARRATEEPE